MLSITMIVWSQATQPCVVLQYNQKENKTSLPGVEVMASNAGSTVSDNEGKLTLSFRTLKPGDKVNLISAKKTGYELFNKEAVEQWNVTRNNTPFAIVLVKSEYFAELKGKLTQASTVSYRAKYEQALRELEQQKTTGKLKEEEFNKKYDELEERFKEQLRNLDNYIDQFARIDLNEVSEEEQRILKMVEQGKIDEAVKAYEELDISGKLRQARENKKALFEAKAKIEEEETRQNQTIEELKAKQDREIATLKLAGGKDNYDKIGRMLKENALVDSTDIKTVKEYAIFAFNQKNFKEAEKFFLICLNGSRNDSYQQSVIQNFLGVLYMDLHDYAKAEEYFLKALDNRSQLFSQNPDAYRADLAVAQNNLGAMYKDLHDYKKAEEYFLRTLENRTLLFNQNPDEYRTGLATIQNNLGGLYLELHDYTKAEKYCLGALENLIQMFNQNPDAYRAELAGNQHNLGVLYLNLHDYAKAEEYYLKTLENRTMLFNQNPDAYRVDLATIQNNLGVLYLDLHDYTKAEEYYLMALENRIQLLNQNPDAYRAILALTQRCLGDLYFETKDFIKAEDFFLQALENYTVLFEKQPDTFRARLAWIQYSLMFIYYKDDNKLNQFDKMLNAALANYEVLYKSNSDYQSNIVDLRNQKGLRYLQTGKIDEAMALFERTYHLAPEKSAFYLASGCNEKAYQYAKTGDYTKAIETIDRAIALMPNKLNYYESKGEILLMKGEEQEAVKMWQKVIEIDPEFLQKYEGGTDFYKQLKERGLLK
jgi:tetratricopeptide (TPR) repeat protein